MFYKVWVRSAQYRGSEPLTYSSDAKLPAGQLVQVQLKKQSVIGVIIADTKRPAFTTKPIDKVYELPPLPKALLQLTEWVQRYYPSPIGVLTQQILPKEFSKKLLDNLPHAENSQPREADLPPLTREQINAVEQITSPGTYILHGKTGSGKTRIYLELAKRAISDQRSVLILTPEISLTSQLAQSFRKVFDTQVFILHSQLSAKERHKVWLQILTSSSPLVVVGPRSTLFSPLKSIGMIVLDESHEAAYKQEQAPYYHATRVAAQLAKLNEAQLVLGSATPSIIDYYVAEQKGRPIIRLKKLAQASPFTTTHTVVDLRDRSQFGQSAHISLPLIAAIHEALDKKEQVLLYLNRRGTARVVLCENCGWQAACPHCDLPLTYHGDTYTLRCHTCGYHQPTIVACPECGHPSILFKAVGTKAITDEVLRLFPEARVQRFDTDNKKSERFEQHYDDVHAGNVDILVGTQILAKGLDLPRLSTLGVLLADSSLSIPDFSAQERTYQLLAQVLGRVGRGHCQGHTVIQTYNPDRAIIKTALSDDWQDFYKAELAERKSFLFPPFCYLLKLTCRRASNAAAEKAALALKQKLQSSGHRLRVEGPAPAFHEKVLNKYQWQLVVKAVNRNELIKAIDLLPAAGWTYDIDPINLL